MKKIIFCVVVAIFSFGLASCGSRNIKPVEERYDFYIKGIETSSLLTLAADLSEKNIVISSEIKGKRIKLNSKNMTVNELMTQVVNYEGLVIKYHNNITMVASSCRLGHTPVVKIQDNLNKTISLNFPDGISYGSVFDLISSQVSADYKVNEEIQKRSLSLQVKNQNTVDFLNALAAIENLVIKQNDSGVIDVSPNRSVSECTRKSVFKQMKRLIPENGLGFICLELDHGKVLKRVCEPAEQYDLKEISLLGYIENKSTFEKYLVIDSPGGYMYLGRENHIGKKHGVIQKIGATGVYIKELNYQAGKYKESNRLINY